MGFGGGVFGAFFLGLGFFGCYICRRLLNFIVNFYNLFGKGKLLEFSIYAQLFSPIIPNLIDN